MPDPYSPCSLASSSRSGQTSPVDSGADFPSSSSDSHASYPDSLSPVNGFGTFSETLSDDEIAQIESFYQGLYSHVYVCPTVAALYLFADGNPGSLAASSPAKREVVAAASRNNHSNTLVSSSQSSPQKPKTGWSLEFSDGVALVVHVTRPGKRNTNSLHFIFAERATGFPLFQDRHLSPASTYSCIDSDYHEFRAADGLRVGLRFGAASAASRFLQQVVTLISNPDTFNDGKSRKNQTTPKKPKISQPKKTSISPPCCFVHRTHIAKDDNLTSLTEFVSSNRKNVLVHDNRGSIAVSSANKIYGPCRS